MGYRLRTGTRERLRSLEREATLNDSKPSDRARSTRSTLPAGIPGSMPMRSETSAVGSVEVLATAGQLVTRAISVRPGLRAECCICHSQIPLSQETTVMVLEPSGPRRVYVLCKGHAAGLGLFLSGVK
jgi:hypothetical protein